MGIKTQHIGQQVVAYDVDCHCLIALGTTNDRISASDKERLKAFFVCDAALGIGWNVIAYAVGYRWLSRSSDDGKQSSVLDQMFGLLWDGAVETSAMYSMFVVLGFAFCK